MAQPQFSCSVSVAYLPEQSQPQAQVHAFSYTVTIVNSGNVTAQLVARQWFMVDANGHTEEVRGLAVVGHQPLLRPGEKFEYTSWTRIATAQGSMRGVYFCMTEDARPFEAAVPEFVLSRPEQLH